MGLFRPEVHHARQQQHLGTIVLNHRPVAWACTVAVLVLMVAIVWLVMLAEYTRRASVQGYLVPNAGVVRVFPPGQGRLSKLLVVEGAAVQQGDILAVVVDERVTADGHDTRVSVLSQVEARQANLRQVIAQQKLLFAQLGDGMRRRLDAMRLEITQIEREAANQRARVRLAESSEERYQELGRSGFVSVSATQERTEAALEQRARLHALERSRTVLNRERVTLESDLESLPMRESTQLAELERALALAEQELAEGRARREVAVTAPQAGRVSGITAQVGYALNVEKPLMTLVPHDAELEAHLFAPSKDVGFVRPGQHVYVRYSAYPYQKFGHYRGTVIEVMRTPLIAEELLYPVAPKVEATGVVPALPVAPANEPLFRVRVRLDRQTALAYGQAHELQAGMQLEADILLDRRTLFEWILEPIYSLRGKYAW